MLATATYNQTPLPPNDFERLLVLLFSEDSERRRAVTA